MQRTTLKIRNLVFIIFLLIPFIITGCKGGAVKSYDSTEITKPNILFIVSENNGPELGCYGLEDVTTPNLDRLATEGILFENAFVTYSVCSPSRSTLFTGLYPHQNGQIGLATHKFSMYKLFKTLPVYLKDAGYRTGCIGKIHVNPESAIPFDFHPIKSANFAKKNLPAYAAYADTFMRKTEEPFFLMVNYPDAHLPLVKQVDGMPAHPLEPEDVEHLLPYVGADSPRMRENTANYYNQMNRLDEAIGMLLEELTLSGKADNTLIIYLGDHGAQFSRGKTTNYEGGLKIPLIISWPGNMQKDQRRMELISTIDLFPTMLEAAGITPPDDLPGFSLLPIIKGDNIKEWREYLFAGGAGCAVQFYYPKRSVRDNRYKLINNLAQDRENPVYRYYLEQLGVHFAAGTNKEEVEQAANEVKQAYETWRIGPEYELYDLLTDPNEFRNLAGDPAYTDILERLKDALLRWQTETQDPFADPLKFEMYRNEVDSIMAKYKGTGYTKDPEFEWKYPEYFYRNQYRK